MSAKAGQITVSPQLSVRRGREAVEFYKAAFGAAEIYRVGGTEEHQAVVAQLSVGDGSFWVADESPANKTVRGPAGRGPRRDRSLTGGRRI